MSVRPGVGSQDGYTLLHALGTTPAVQKELLRHANLQTTLKLYTQAVSKAKREAASKLVGFLWKN